MNNINSINKSLKFDCAFVGLSHLGLVSGICTASLGKKVLALDENKKIVNSLLKGHLEVSEPGLKELLQKCKKNYLPSSDFKLVSNSPLVFMSLDTPTDKPFNLKQLNSLIDKTIPHLTDNSILVLMSQVPVGFSRKFSQKIKSKRPDLNIQLYYLLNTLIIGDSVNRFLKPERFVIGTDSADKPLIKTLQQFLNLFKAPIFQMSYESAELTKSAINLYLTSSIITTNTLADFCEITGADINEIIPALKSDKRIGPYAYLKPTLRISGGHLERELVKLDGISQQYKSPIGIVGPLIKLNNSRINWLFKKIQILSKSQKIKTITLWGLAYKKDTESTDNAASVEVLKKLSTKFSFKVYDPKAVLDKKISGFKRFKDKYSALKKSDLLIVLTDWGEFKNVDNNQLTKHMRRLNIIDCVDVMQKADAINLIQIGRA